MGKGCYIYTRVSTTYQNQKDNVTLTVQKEACLNYAKRSGLTVIEEPVEEVGSGRGVASRHKLTYLIEKIESGEALIVYSISRLARNTVECINLYKLLRLRGCKILSATEECYNGDGPLAELMMTIMASLSQFESATTGERIKASIQHRRNAGGIVGKIPFGYVINPVDKKLAENETEQQVIKVMKEKRNQLNHFGRPKSYGEIAKELNDCGYAHGPKAKKWHAATIQRILVREEHMKKVKVKAEQDDIASNQEEAKRLGIVKDFIENRHEEPEELPKVTDTSASAAISTIRNAECDEPVQENDDSETLTLEEIVMRVRYCGELIKHYKAERENPSACQEIIDERLSGHMKEYRRLCEIQDKIILGNVVPEKKPELAAEVSSETKKAQVIRSKALSAVLNQNEIPKVSATKGRAKSSTRFP